MSRTKEEVYDEEISPLMVEIIRITKEHGIAMLASFSIPTEEHPHLLCTTHLPDDSGKPFAKFVDAAKTIRHQEPSLFAFTITTEPKR